MNPLPPDDTESEVKSDLEDPIAVKEFVLPALGALSDTKARQIIADLQHAIEALQTQNNAQRSKIVELRAKVVVLSRRRKGKSKKGEKAPENAPFSIDAVTQLGKKWVVMEGMWTHPSAFLQYPNDTMPHPQSPEQFTSVEAYNLGAVKQLHEFLGTEEARQHAAESLMFRDKFMSGSSSQKSTTLLNLRKAAGRIFEGASVPAGLWENDSWSERGKNDIMRQLRSAPEDAPNRASNPFSSFLFPGGNYNMALVFHSTYVWKAMRVILFGGASLGENASIVRQNLVGNAWQVRRVTSAFIAFTAVMLQFILNGDDALAPKGAKSKVEYWDNYRSFHQLVETSITSNPSWATALFSYLNVRVFKGTVNHTAEQEESRMGAINQAMLDLTVGASSPSTSAAPQEHNQPSISATQPAIATPIVSSPLQPAVVETLVEPEPPIADEPQLVPNEPEPVVAPSAHTRGRGGTRGGARGDAQGSACGGTRRSARNTTGTKGDGDEEADEATPTPVPVAKSKRGRKKN
ncbi:hypothetical protein PM082_011536 [Marasmius tenuissimus]|nr:hypothetical protein PM082_011536 [Marasmius tenuissimus]